MMIASGSEVCSRHSQSCITSHSNQDCSGTYWENISPWSFSYDPRTWLILDIYARVWVVRVHVLYYILLEIFRAWQSLLVRDNHLALNLIFKTLSIKHIYSEMRVTSVVIHVSNNAYFIQMFVNHQCFLVCVIFIAVDDPMCMPCLNTSQKGQRPTPEQFDKFLPFYLKDNPETTCTKGWEKNHE